MKRPLLLDLFCGAGGAAVGYHRAGFDVIGVDLRPQPHYPFRFVRADALNPPFDLARFDLIHASPPCQAYSRLAAMHPERTYPDLLARTRRLLEVSGRPFVIENVEGSPMAHAPRLDGRWGIVLCGSMFRLGIDRGQLRRHRAFESSFPVPQPSCAHVGKSVGVYGHGGHSKKHRMLYRAEAAVAMGIDWMGRDAMTQAIPPAYTEFIGRAFLGRAAATPGNAGAPFHGELS